ncbi:MAG: alanine racemase [Alphaproteobacteria bacterium]|nr:alanine racemase [Alphaproteobacteria bacterium]
MEYPAFKRALDGERLPAALVDLDALERNVDRLVALLGDKTLRVASKSVRHTGLMRRILARGGARLRGLMCFTAAEAAWLHTQGFDDLLVAYPTVQPQALDALARAAAQGATVWAVVDCPAHLAALDRAGREAGVVLRAVLELDVSYRPLGGRVHLGARRSPIRSAAGALALARAAESFSNVRIAGLMAYEGHLAGLPDDNPFSRAMNPARRTLKKLAWPRVTRLRAQVVEALQGAGVTLELVNGGGTGSVALTAREPCVTEVTAGSGFVCPHLFSYFVGLALEPAAFFALEVCRVSDPGFVTALGGGYVASGEPGWDRLPLPWSPPGMAYVSIEGAGEVQTPLQVPPGVQLDLGDPVIFRHAKAGELAERFNDYLLLRDGRVVAREPTYRGQGQAFL